jgi:Sushi repeat (SCR repeat)
VSLFGIDNTAWRMAHDDVITVHIPYQCIICQWSECFIRFLLAVDCGLPPVIGNAEMTFDATTYGSDANYACFSGYWLQRNVFTMTLSCTAQGQWTNNATQLANCTRELYQARKLMNYELFKLNLNNF